MTLGPPRTPAQSAPPPSPGIPIQPRHGARDHQHAPHQLRVPPPPWLRPLPAGPAPGRATRRIWRGRGLRPWGAGTPPCRPLWEPRGPDWGAELNLKGVGDQPAPHRSLRPRTPLPRDTQWYVPERPTGLAPGRRGFFGRGRATYRKGRGLPRPGVPLAGGAARARKGRRRP